MGNKIEKAIKEYRMEGLFTKRYFDYFILIVAFVLAIALDWGTAEIALLLAAIYLFLNPIKSQLYATGALLALVLTPVALVLGRETKADKLAIVAYGLLALTVVTDILENKKKI